MAKQSKFNKAFAYPMQFDDWDLLVVSAELYTKEQAMEQFNEYIREWNDGGSYYRYDISWEIYDTMVVARYNFEEQNTRWWIDDTNPATNFHKPVWCLPINYWETKPSSEWAESNMFFLTIIISPDGWDANNYNYSFNEERIKRAEFEKRLANSVTERAKNYEEYKKIKLVKFWNY